MGTLKIFGDADIDNPQLLTKVSLGLENTLLRGARLKDTEFIYGDPFVFFPKKSKWITNSTQIIFQDALFTLDKTRKWHRIPN
jgi:hypothetical protein